MAAFKIDRFTLRFSSINQIHIKALLQINPSENWLCKHLVIDMKTKSKYHLL